MRRRRVVLLTSGLCLSLFVGCGSSWVAALAGLIGSWHSGIGYMSVHQPEAARQTGTGDSLEIYYPSGVTGTDWSLVGTALKSGNTWTGTFEVLSGPTTRQSGPLVVGADVTVRLVLDHDSLTSTISGTGTPLVQQWTRVDD